MRVWNPCKIFLKKSSRWSLSPFQTAKKKSLPRMEISQFSNKLGDVGIIKKSSHPNINILKKLNPIELCLEKIVTRNVFYVSLIFFLDPQLSCKRLLFFSSIFKFTTVLETFEEPVLLSRIGSILFSKWREGGHTDSVKKRLYNIECKLHANEQIQ